MRFYPRVELRITSFHDFELQRLNSECCSLGSQISGAIIGWSTDYLTHSERRGLSWTLSLLTYWSRQVKNWNTDEGPEHFNLPVLKSFKGQSCQIIRIRNATRESCWLASFNPGFEKGFEHFMCHTWSITSSTRASRCLSVTCLSMRRKALESNKEYSERVLWDTNYTNVYALAFQIKNLGTFVRVIFLPTPLMPS